MKTEVLPFEGKWVIRRTRRFLWKRSCSFMSSVTYFWFTNLDHVLNNCLFKTKEEAEAKLTKLLAYEKLFHDK